MERTVLVTGCSSGIGRATAEAFLAEDWTVWASARDVADVSDLSDAGCETAELDVTDPGDCATAVAELVEAEGRIDCLVNNAGFSQTGPIEDVPTRRVHRQFDVNLYGPHRLVREALPHMREAGEGTIVNVSSVQGRLAMPGQGVYAASKFALEGYSDALRVEAGRFGVDTVLVEPGPVETNFHDRGERESAALDRTPDYEFLYEAYEDAGSLQGVAGSTPEEVADVVVHAATCADPATRYPVGKLSSWLLLGRYLPDRVRDRAFGLLARLIE
ncbi:MAG: SDR family oxidoreductase [Halobacteriaceae archaeon]